MPGKVVRSNIYIVIIMPEALDGGVGYSYVCLD